MTAKDSFYDFYVFTWQHQGNEAWKAAEELELPHDQLVKGDTIC